MSWQFFEAKNVSETEEKFGFENHYQEVSISSLDEQLDIEIMQKRRFTVLKLKSSNNPTSATVIAHNYNIGLLFFQ